MSQNPPPTAPNPWPRAFTVVAIAALLIGAGLYVFNSLRSVPADLVDSGREVLHDLKDLAAAFNQGEVKTSFLSYATEINGTNHLQFATLNEMELFQREDYASTLWGQLALPEVIVTATAPVEYTYYLDLNGAWTFRLDSGVLFVEAPAIQFNRPSINVSQIQYNVSQDSVFRDEDEALENLRQGLTPMVHRRAQENIPLVRELGRRKTEEFVRNWLAERFTDDAERVSIRVSFAEESRPLLGQPDPEGVPPTVQTGAPQEGGS